MSQLLNFRVQLQQSIVEFTAGLLIDYYTGGNAHVRIRARAYRELRFWKLPSLPQCVGSVPDSWFPYNDLQQALSEFEFGHKIYGRQ